MARSRSLAHFALLALALLGWIELVEAAAPPAGTSTAREALAPLDLGVARAAKPLEVKEVEGVRQRLFRDGRVYIGGQPSEAALRRLHALGVTAVVNFRTAEEMADRDEVPYDEAATVQALGLEYLHLPIGGSDYPYRTEVLDRVAELLRRHRGPVLLHCTVGWRASYVWAGLLVREGGLSLEEALGRGRAIALTEDPLSRLLGRPLKLIFVDAETSGSAP